MPLTIQMQIQGWVSRPLDHTIDLPKGILIGATGGIRSRTNIKPFPRRGFPGGQCSCYRNARFIAIGIPSPVRSPRGGTRPRIDSIRNGSSDCPQSIGNLKSCAKPTNGEGLGSWSRSYPLHENDAIPLNQGSWSSGNGYFKVSRGNCKIRWTNTIKKSRPKKCSRPI